MGGLAPSSLTIGSLLTTSWPAVPAGKMDWPEKWIRQSHNLANGVYTKILPRLIQVKLYSNSPPSFMKLEFINRQLVILINKLERLSLAGLFCLFQYFMVKTEALIKCGALTSQGNILIGLARKNALAYYEILNYCELTVYFCYCCLYCYKLKILYYQYSQTFKPINCQC